MQVVDHYMENLTIRSALLEILRTYTQLSLMPVLKGILNLQMLGN